MTKVLAIFPPRGYRQDHVFMRYFRDREENIELMDASVRL